MVYVSIGVMSIFSFAERRLVPWRANTEAVYLRYQATKIVESERICLWRGVGSIRRGFARLQRRCSLSNLSLKTAGTATPDLTIEGLSDCAVGEILGYGSAVEKVRVDSEGSVQHE
jgi:membrane protein YdbS with pleckstrin-like domain